jgi:hypothetical protein
VVTKTIGGYIKTVFEDIANGFGWEILEQGMKKRPLSPSVQCLTKICSINCCRKTKGFVSQRSIQAVS